MKEKKGMKEKKCPYLTSLDPLWMCPYGIFDKLPECTNGKYKKCPVYVVYEVVKKLTKGS